MANFDENNGVLNAQTNELEYVVGQRGGGDFVADASQLGLKPGQMPANVIITSARTGKKIEFYRSRIDADGNGFYVAFNLAPYKLTILND